MDRNPLSPGAGRLQGAGAAARLHGPRGEVQQVRGGLRARAPGGALLPLTEMKARQQRNDNTS